MDTDLHDLTGVYAGGALPTQERRRMDEHLGACPRCAQETRELLETAALLGVAAAAVCPPSLRARVFAQLASTPQLPPLLSQWRPPHRRAAARPRRRVLLAAACAAVVALGVGVQGGALAPGGRQIDQVQALPTAPTRMLTVTAGPASATVTLSAGSDRMAFVARGLDGLGAGRTYQLWLVGADGVRPAATFLASAEGAAAATVAGPGDATALSVTEEPVGGSALPTSAPLLTLDLRPA